MTALLSARPAATSARCVSGDTPDIQWEAKRILVRRSQVRGNSIRNTTKQGVRYAIDLPGDVIEVLRWHADTQLETDEQKASELLFPALHGGFRATTVLGKPFAIVSREIELGYDFTPPGMRRTFNDLARAAKVEDLVTRSISGHLTERMQHHYSTVRGDEQRQAVAKVIDLMTARSSRASGAVSAAEPQHHSTTQNCPSEPRPTEPSGASGGASHMASGAIPTAGQASTAFETSEVGTP